MSKFEVRMIAHSISDANKELITMQLKYPRFIHAEFMTHREFSRNASSSRAIPVAKMIEQVRNAPAMPIHWGANQPGMQADNELTAEAAEAAKSYWMRAADQAADLAYEMNELGLHKQVANRILEPFQWMSVIMTTSNLSNFFGLRCHKDAQPEIKHLAEMMRDCYNASTPVLLREGEWHLPYIGEEDWVEAYRNCKVGRVNRDEPKHDEMLKMLQKASVARCARVSYLTHDGQEPSLEKDLALYERLVGSEPLHASPTEHQACPDRWDNHEGWYNQELHGNLIGWKQLRKTLKGEYIN